LGLLVSGAKGGRGDKRGLAVGGLWIDRRGGGGKMHKGDWEAGGQAWWPSCNGNVVTTQGKGCPLGGK